MVEQASTGASFSSVGKPSSTCSVGEHALAPSSSKARITSRSAIVFPYVQGHVPNPPSWKRPKRPKFASGAAFGPFSTCPRSVQVGHLENSFPDASGADFGRFGRLV